jgi:hypothetical protein
MSYGRSYPGRRSATSFSLANREPLEPSSVISSAWQRRADAGAETWRAACKLANDDLELLVFGPVTPPTRLHHLKPSNLSPEPSECASP